jgi:hypothetical protein
MLSGDSNFNYSLFSIYKNGLNFCLIPNDLLLAMGTNPAGENHRTKKEASPVDQYGSEILNQGMAEMFPVWESAIKSGNISVPV